MNEQAENDDLDLKSVELDDIAIETNNPEVTANTQAAAFDPFNQQTNELLDVKDNKLNLIL